MASTMNHHLVWFRSDLRCADNPALHQALHELAAFALFAATTTLPRDQELALSRDVNTRLKRLRIS